VSTHHCYTVAGLPFLTNSERNDRGTIAGQEILVTTLDFVIP
jgi:hypothetical protein